MLSRRNSGVNDDTEMKFIVSQNVRVMLKNAYCVAVFLVQLFWL